MHRSDCLKELPRVDSGQGEVQDFSYDGGFTGPRLDRLFLPLRTPVYFV